MAGGRPDRSGATTAFAGLWVLLAVLLLAGGWLFLRACGTVPILGWGWNFCPVPPDHSAFDREVAEGQGLIRQVHVAEMALAEVPPCTPPASPPPMPPPPTPPRATPPEPPPTPTRRSDESRRLDDTVEQRGGKAGRLQFTLKWATRDDLDISVDCPGGRIGSRAGQKGPGICGDGEKDIDANRNLQENMSSTPIENISWSRDIPDGLYTIEIIEYRAQTNTGNTVPFTLRMRWGDKEKICHDVVSTLPASEVHRRGLQTITGSYRTIAWRSGGDLPDCVFKQMDAVSGPVK